MTLLKLQQLAITALEASYGEKKNKPSAPLDTLTTFPRFPSEADVFLTNTLFVNWPSSFSGPSVRPTQSSFVPIHIFTLLSADPVAHIRCFMETDWAEA
jgi:hypothetical protein